MTELALLALAAMSLLNLLMFAYERRLRKRLAASPPAPTLPAHAAGWLVLLDDQPWGYFATKREAHAYAQAAREYLPRDSVSVQALPTLPPLHQPKGQP